MSISPATWLVLGFFVLFLACTFRGLVKSSRYSAYHQEAGRSDLYHIGVVVLTLALHMGIGVAPLMVMTMVN